MLSSICEANALKMPVSTTSHQVKQHRPAVYTTPNLTNIIQLIPDKANRKSLFSPPPYQVSKDLNTGPRTWHAKASPPKLGGLRQKHQILAVEKHGMAFFYGTSQQQFQIFRPLHLSPSYITTKNKNPYKRHKCKKQFSYHSAHPNTS